MKSRNRFLSHFSAIEHNDDDDDDDDNSKDSLQVFETCPTGIVIQK